MQEFPVEVIPDGVINEALRSLGFTTGLILKHHIIIPPKPMNAYKKMHQNRTTLKLKIIKKVHTFDHKISGKLDQPLTFFSR